MRNNKWEVIPRIIMPPSSEGMDVIFMKFWESIFLTVAVEKGSKIITKDLYSTLMYNIIAIKQQDIFFDMVEF